MQTLIKNSVACILSFAGATSVSGQSTQTVNPALLRLGSDTMRIVAIIDSHERHRGVAISELKLASKTELEQRFTYDVPGEIRMIATTRISRRNLEPISQVHDYGNGDSVVVTFAPASIIADRWDAKGTYERDAALRVDRPVFTSATIDLVLRALPLRAGFRTKLPTYFMPLRRVIDMDVRVVGVDTAVLSSGTKVDCWLVEAEFPGPARERFWISRQTRDLVRILAHTGPDALERYER